MSSPREQELVRELETVRQELRTTEEHLVAAARRAANAGLAYSLTHEINNALTPIIGNAQILALLHAQNPETVERVGQIITNARRIAGWTATFRQLASESSRESMEYSFNGLAKEVFEFYAERLQRLGISTRLELDTALPALRGSPDQIQQLLMLLLQNAIEAMPRGGQISLQTVFDRVDNNMIATLTDSGAGIAPEQQARLFEPRFSAKQEPRQGRAEWGLFTTRQIVQAHGGSIEISSPAAAGVPGTRVKLRLPFLDQVLA